MLEIQSLAALCFTLSIQIVKHILLLSKGSNSTTKTVQDVQSSDIEKSTLRIIKLSKHFGRSIQAFSSH